MDCTYYVPLSMAQKIRYKSNRIFNILTAAWKRSGCFFPSLHAIFACMVFTFHFSFPLCAIFPRSELRCFFPPQSLFPLASLLLHLCAVNSMLCWLLQQMNWKQRRAAVVLGLWISKRRIPGGCLCLECCDSLLDGAAALPGSVWGVGLCRALCIQWGWAGLVFVHHSVMVEQPVLPETFHLYLFKLAIRAGHLPLTWVLLLCMGLLKAGCAWGESVWPPWAGSEPGISSWLVRKAWTTH